MSSFCGKNICETYQSILNVGTSDNDVIPSSPGSQIIITDGLGNCSSLSVGQVNQGATVTGQLSTSGQFFSLGLSYPTLDGTADQVVKTNGSGTLSFDSVCNLLPQASTAIGSTTTYTKLSSVTVDSKGRVSNVTKNDDIVNVVKFITPNNIFTCNSTFEYTTFSLSVPASAKAVILEASHSKSDATPTCILVRQDSSSCSYTLSYFNSVIGTSLIGTNQGTFPIFNSSLQMSLTGGSVDSASVCAIGYWI